MRVDKYEPYRTQVDFMKKYARAKNAASGSEVDANSNVSNKNIATMMPEIHKKANIYANRLWMHDKIQELYGEELAEEYLRQLEEHEIYMQDETLPIATPYCASITLYPFLTDGLKGIGGTTGAPKHLKSFIGGFINLVFAVSAQLCGAVATPEFFAYMDYFVRKEYGDDYYKRANDVVDIHGNTIDSVITDCFDQVVYSLNQPAAARASQSCFFNFAYFDKPYFEQLFEGFVFPDGGEMQWESVSWLQKRFMKWFNKERLKNILTFPVETLSLLNDGKTFVDEEWADFAAEMYAEGHSFFTYTSDSVDSLASCCFAPDTKVVARIDSNVYVESISSIYYRAKEMNVHTVGVPYKGTFRDAVPIRLPKRDMYVINTCDYKSVIATDNHLFSTLRGDVKAEDITTQDCIEIDPLFTDEDYVKSGRDYVTRDGRVYAPVLFAERMSTEEYDADYEGDSYYVYCFEMVDQSEPYFTLANGMVTHNCRLRNGIQDNTFSYTLGAGGISTGSKRVITINVNRLVQNATKAGIPISEAVSAQVDKVHKYLLAFNSILYEMFEQHMIPIYDAGFVTPEKQYLTVGVNGLVEGAEFLGIPISDNDSYKYYVHQILEPIYEANKRDRTDTVMFNTEMVPAENLGVKNARWDKRDGYNVNRDCYNSYFYLVEDPQTTVVDKFRMHGAAYTDKLDGGSALHVNLEEHLTKEQYASLLHYAVQTGCNYFTFNIPNTLCNDCGYISKHKLDKCPHCGSENLDYATRIIGYLTLISKWSEERQEESKRRYYADTVYM